MPIPYLPQTWVDGSGGGTPISAARLNVVEAGIRDTSQAPAVRVFHNAAQLITSGVTTALAFNSERYDQASGSAAAHHDTVTNNSRLTCLYAGIYLISGGAEWLSNPSNATIRIRLNGTTELKRSQVVGDYRVMAISTQYSLAVSDYVELVVSQSSGFGININTTANYSPEFMMARIA